MQGGRSGRRIPRMTTPGDNGSAKAAAKDARPFFSVVVACCDVEKYVRECFASLTGQAFADWECIAYVETSKDATERVVREIAAADPHIRVLTGPRSGSCSVSRNVGIDEARGEYLVFVDGDDTLETGSLARLHAAISARPGADLYPCALEMYDGATGKTLEMRDNYGPDAEPEMTGPEATVYVGERHYYPCPMLQMAVFRRAFLLDNGLRCIPGLRHQDSEFSLRALYLAARVAPLHEKIYKYRRNPESVQGSARGMGWFLDDFAVILHSAFAFHAKVSARPGFDRRVSECWCRQWISTLFLKWFGPGQIRTIPRSRRLETLRAVFRDGTADYRKLLAAGSAKRKLAGWLVLAFLRMPPFRPAVEAFFAKLYFPLADARGRNGPKT